MRFTVLPAVVHLASVFPSVYFISASLRLCAFASLRLCVFASLRLCVFAPLRLCVFAPLRLCVKTGAMKLKLACADFAFPLLPHDRALDLIAMLEFDGVDIGLFEKRSHLWPHKAFQPP